MSLPARMICLTRRGAQSGGFASPSRIFALALQSLDVVAEVPPPPASAGATGSERAGMRSSEPSPAQSFARLVRFEIWVCTDQSPSSAYGVSCRAGAKGACAPTRVGGLAPVSGSPARHPQRSDGSAFTGYYARQLTRSTGGRKHFLNIRALPHLFQ